MILNSTNFDWYEEITKIKNQGKHNSLFSFENEYRCVSGKKIRQAIDKFGVNTKCINGRFIIDYMCAEMSYKHIDIVMEYNPNFIINGSVFFPSNIDGYSDYIMEKILESDTKYKYNKTPFIYGRYVYVNLLEFVKKNNRYGHNNKKMLMLKNHMKKEITLFYKLLHLLQNNNKKIKFY